MNCRISIAKAIALLATSLLFSACNSIFTNPEKLSTITGVAFPPFEITRTSSDSGNRDTGHRVDARFLDVPSDEFFDVIDSVIESQKGSKLEGYGLSPWGKQGDVYTYSVMWGNSMPYTPPGLGRYADEDGFLTIEVAREKRNFVIEYGTW